MAAGWSAAAFGRRQRSRPLAGRRIGRDRTSISSSASTGQSCGAVYVASQGQAIFLGATRQLLGGDSPNVTDFRYAGSGWPIAAWPPLVEAFQRVGQALAKEFPLAGLFGVDAVVVDQTVWPVEINPRYTASVEILERSGRIAARRHASACAGLPLPARSPARLSRAGQTENPLGQANSLRSPRSRNRPDGGCAVPVDRWRGADPPFADIPPAGSQIASGRPILTVFACGQGPGRSANRAGRTGRERRAFALR